jgi:predicted transcriptional regulator
MWHRGKKPSVASRLGPLESALLSALWKRGNATVRELLGDGFADSAYTTIMTTLDRLHKKGLLDRISDGRAYRYSPRQTQEEFEGMRLAGVVQQVLGGSAQSSVLLSFLVDAVSQHDAALLEQLQRAIEHKRRELRSRESAE